MQCGPKEPFVNGERALLWDFAPDQIRISSGVFRRELVGLTPLDDVTDKQFFTMQFSLQYKLLIPWIWPLLSLTNKSIKPLKLHQNRLFWKRKINIFFSGKAAWHPPQTNLPTSHSLDVSISTQDPSPHWEFLATPLRTSAKVDAITKVGVQWRCGQLPNYFGH